MIVDVHDLRQAVDDVALAATFAGYRPRSFWEAERLLDTMGDELPGVLQARQGLPHVTFALGCYLAEVVRRARGGGPWAGMAGGIGRGWGWIVDDLADGLSPTFELDGGLT